MITILLAGFSLAAVIVAYRAGHGEGYAAGYDSGLKHRNDPVIPPGGKLPFNITKARP